jgi:membrane-associated phospholipid phosphatase
VAVLALLLLGWLVGSGTTVVDQPFFRHDWDAAAWRQHWLLFFTDWRMLVSVLLLCLIVALYRRWWVAAAAVIVCPALGLLCVYVLKRLFDRYKDGALAYPSGHTTQVVIAMGLLVMIVSARLWVVAIAVTVSLLGMIGMVAVGYHYVTDTIGGALLATTIVCLAAQLAGVRTPASRQELLDYRQPG